MHCELCIIYYLCSVNVTNKLFIKIEKYEKDFSFNCGNARGCSIIRTVFERWF